MRQADIRAPDCVEIDATSRSRRIYEHGISADASWWDDTLTREGFGAGCVRGARGGITVASGTVTISRGDIFRMADEACEDPKAALEMLWHALAWGAGSKLRLCRKRVRAARLVPDLGKALARTARLARSDAAAAYAEICPRPHENLVPYLGPAFATKFLYFAGAGREGHPCVILDSRVATALRDRCGWTTLPVKPFWRASDYEQYCNLLQEWARQKSETIGRLVGADEFERCLFGN